MPISTDDLKQFAAGLAVADSDETQLRASISRAYYAAFHSLLPFVSRLPRSKACPRECHHVSHEEMLQRLLEWRVDDVNPKLAEMTTTKGRLVRAMDASRALRVKADYTLTANVRLGECQMQIERARQVMRHALQLHEAAGSTVAVSSGGAA